MELRHLRYFIAVAEELHFSRAAQKLHVAQPAISEQIRKLEQELGVLLFDRAGGVSLTASGAAMLEEARRVVRQAEVAARVARSARDDSTRRVRVGYLPDSLPAALPRALRQLSRATPQLDVALEPGDALPLIEDLRARRLDAVVAALPAPAHGLRVTPIAQQHAIAAVPAGHPQALNAAIVLEWIAREPLVVLRHEANPAFHNAVVAMCRAAGLSPSFVTADNVEHALLAVAAGAGIALLPESVGERHVAPGVRLLPVKAAEPAFESVLLTHPEAESAPVTALLRAVSRAVRTPAVEAPALASAALSAS